MRETNNIRGAVCWCVCVPEVVRHSSQALKNIGDSHACSLALSRSVSVGVLASLMQRHCKQVINGSEHCSYAWSAEAGGGEVRRKCEQKFQALERFLI